METAFTILHPRCPEFVPGTCDRAEPSLRAVGYGQGASCFLYPST